MPLIPILVRMPKKILESSDVLMNQVLEDEDLEFYLNHTGSKSAWFRYVFQRGLTQIKKDFIEQKKRLEQE